MREIKFRAWDNVGKAMLSSIESWHKTWKGDDTDPENEYDYHSKELYISQDGHVLEHTDEHGICDTHYYLQGKPHYTLMQYIGLKDKNKVEIYEGDIFEIQVGSYETNFVEFYEGNYLLNEHGLHLSDWNDRGAVIGNIYENPELLKED